MCVCLGCHGKRPLVQNGTRVFLLLEKYAVFPETSAYAQCLVTDCAGDLTCTKQRLKAEAKGAFIPGCN